jgi:hypothetical protein
MDTKPELMLLLSTTPVLEFLNMPRSVHTPPTYATPRVEAKS